MSRMIRYFDKSNESFAGEYELPPFDIAQLQKIFAVSATNPMYDSFFITENHAMQLSSLFSFDFDCERFDYYLEYEE